MDMYANEYLTVQGFGKGYFKVMREWNFIDNLNITVKEKFDHAATSMIIGAQKQKE